MACFQLPSARVPVSRQNIVSFKFSQKFPVEGTGSSKITLSLYLMTFYIKQKSFGTEPFFQPVDIFLSFSVRAHISECLSEYCLSQRESINHWEKINFCFVHYRWDALCFLNDVSDKPTQAGPGWKQSEKYAWNIENTSLGSSPGSRGEINPKWLNFPQTSHLGFVQTVSKSCETKRQLHCHV